MTTNLCSIAQARKLLGCGLTTLNALVSSGKLSFVQFVPGGKRYIERAVLDDFISAGRKGGWDTAEKPRAMAVGRRKGWIAKTKGAGSIRQRRRIKPDGSIYTFYEGEIALGIDGDGRRVRRTVTGSSEAEVRQQLDAIDRRPKTSLDAERMTLKAYLAEWLEDVKANKAINTYRAREAVVRPHINPHLGDIRLVDLGPDHIRRLLKRLRENGVGGRTCQLVRTTLHVALGNAFKMELIHRNPTALVDPPKYERRSRVILNLEQVKALFKAAAGTPYEALIVLAVTTGARQGELFALRWCDVNLDEGFISINATLTTDAAGQLVRSTPKTRTSIRRVPLPALARAALRALRLADGSGNETLVFKAPAGGPIRKSLFIRRYFHPLLKKAELPRVPFHSLRHVCVSLLLAGGQNEKVIAGLVGHASSRLTMDVYAHIPPTALAGAAEAMDRVMRIAGTFAGTGSKVIVLDDRRVVRKAKQNQSLKQSGRSRVRTYDPSRVKNK